jgi:hypothetical protein
MSIQPLLGSDELFLPPDFMDEKETLKRYLNKALETIVNQNQNRTEPYFVLFHEKSDAVHSRQKIRVETQLPGFLSNSICWWVNNKSGICEWLWTVPPREKGKKLRVEFNTSGVAYLQAKGAMPA